MLFSNQEFRPDEKEAIDKLKEHFTKNEVSYER